MTILLGHPTGSPNAHHAVLAHLEAGRLEAFCVSWIPSALTLACLAALPGVGALARRLARRRFGPLEAAPTIEGPWPEWRRMAGRLIGVDPTRLADDANDWLMHAMRRELARARVTAVHGYEDCALAAFEAARATGKFCIYDMPTGYFAAWQTKQARLLRDYADWLPARPLPREASVRVERKRREMELADIVLAPSRFAEATIRAAWPDKKIALAPYGVDAEFWSPAAAPRRGEKLRFVFAGQVSLLKGIPALIAAWRKAALRDAALELIGPWRLAETMRRSLPSDIVCQPACAPEMLRERYRAADVAVFPSHFEGFGLALTEAMACGLPVLASRVGVAPELVTPSCGRVFTDGDIEALIDGLRWFAGHRDEMPIMGQAARRQAEGLTWPRYRRQVTEAVAPYV